MSFGSEPPTFGSTAGLLVRGLGERGRGPARPRMLGIEPRRVHDVVARLARSAPSESRGGRDGGAARAGTASGSVPTTKRICPRAQARGGTAFTGLSGMPDVIARISNVHQAKTFSASVSPGSAQFGSISGSPGPDFDLAIGERAPHRVRNAVRHPFGNADLPGRSGDGRERMHELDRRARQQPAPVARMVAALARVDPDVDREGAARAERDGRAVGGEARPVRADQHVGGEQIAVLGAQLAQARRAGLLAHLDQPFGVEAELAALGQHRRLRGDVDRVLALVVDHAAAVVAAVLLGQRPGRQARRSSRHRARG